MGKDIRTTATEMKLHKYPRLDTSAWSMKNAQPFFPPLEKLFKTETVANLQEYGVRLTDEIQRVVDADHVQVKGQPVEVHRKTTMILSPFKWMKGDYGTMGLPKPEDVAEEMQERLQSPHTAGYVGAITSIALSESGCIHFPKVYGVYVGLGTSHTIDISEDYEEMSERKWFTDNIGKTFEMKLRAPESGASSFKHTRSQRIALALGEETLLDDIRDIDAEHMSAHSSHTNSHSHMEDDSEDSDETSTEESEDEYEIKSCDCSDVSEDGLDDDGDDEPFAWATFTDVPVITTVMEKLHGTFYDLLEKHPEPNKHTAWVAQIVFALAYAQRNYGFTHNDLHGNNVMYVPTESEFLFYKLGGQCFQVPTYGYLIKIIDFDRAITSVRLCGMKEPRQFMSSQFQSEDEAAGQYNMEPFYTQDHARIPPNPSFDLCRFATSVFWDMFPEGPDHSYTHPLFEAFKQWMTQPDGTSVMFRKERDRHDRYHGFDLYKAIARYCKDSANPRREIAKLATYRVATVPIGSQCLHIES
jgi:hypothetical protein